ASFRTITKGAAKTIFHTPDKRMMANTPTIKWIICTTSQTANSLKEYFLFTEINKICAFQPFLDGCSIISGTNTPLAYNIARAINSRHWLVLIVFHNKYIGNSVTETIGNQNM